MNDKVEAYIEEASKKLKEKYPEADKIINALVNTKKE